MKNKKTLFLLAALAALLVAARLLYPMLAQRYAPGGGLLGMDGAGESVDFDLPSGTEASLAPEEDLAPDFTVEDGQGEEVDLSDFFGKPIAINLWATWCPPCAGELPAFDRAWEAYGDQVSFLMVNLTDGERDTVESVKEYVEEAGYSFPVYYDTQFSAAITYGANSIPMTILIDAHGQIVAGQIGAVDEQSLMTALETLVGLP